jgi:hypothetical protein
VRARARLPAAPLARHGGPGGARWGGAVSRSVRRECARGPLGKPDALSLGPPAPARLVSPRIPNHEAPRRESPIRPIPPTCACRGPGRTGPALWPTRVCARGRAHAQRGAALPQHMPRTGRRGRPDAGPRLALPPSSWGGRWAGQRGGGNARWRLGDGGARAAGRAGAGGGVVSGGFVSRAGGPVETGFLRAPLPPLRLA